MILAGGLVVNTIVFVTNISQKLIGKNICGFTLRKAYRGSTKKCDYLNKKLLSWQFADKLLGYDSYMIANQPDTFLHSDKLGEYYLYFQKESVDKSVDNFIETGIFIKSITLYKTSGVSFTYPYSFSDNHGTVILKSPFHNYYSFNNWPEFDLEDSELIKLEEFYGSFQKVEVNKELIDRMINLWMTSRRTHIFEIKFILNITILEMFIKANSKITYNLSKSIAAFLGSSSENYMKIYRNMKKLYKARSKFLHNGNENKIDENEINAQNYARELIVKIILLSSKYQKEIDTIREEINKLKSGDYYYYLQD